MNLQQMNHAFTSFLDIAAGLALLPAITYCGGYIYGTLCNADKVVAARAFTISLLVYYAFQAIAHYAAGDEKKNPHAFFAVQLLGTDALGFLQILAYRRLNLIGTVGTGVFSAFIIIGSLPYLTKINKLYLND